MGDPATFNKKKGWDRHGPTEDVAEVTLEAGRHAFRLEHFEIDGWAWLSFRLEHVP